MRHVLLQKSAVFKLVAVPLRCSCDHLWSPLLIPLSSSLVYKPHVMLIVQAPQFQLRQHPPPSKILITKVSPHAPSIGTPMGLKVLTSSPESSVPSVMPSLLRGAESCMYGAGRLCPPPPMDGCGMCLPAPASAMSMMSDTLNTFKSVHSTGCQSQLVTVHPWIGWDHISGSYICMLCV